MYWIEDQLADVSTRFYTSASWSVGELTGYRWKWLKNENHTGKVVQIMWKFHSDFKPVDWMIAVDSMVWGIHQEENPQLTGSQMNTGGLLKTNTRFLYSSSTGIFQPWMATRNKKCSSFCCIIITDFSFVILCFKF